MYKTLAFSALFLSSGSFASMLEEINCETYDPSLQPYKTKFTWGIERETLDMPLEEFFAKLAVAYPDVEPAHRRWLFKLLDKKTGKYSKTQVVRSYQEQAGKSYKIEKVTVQPPWVVNVDGEILIGTNNGEFGGELLRVDKANNMTLLEQMNVEDVYKMPFGVVVTSGLAHLSSNTGKISLLTPDFKLETLFGLIGSPQSSWLLGNGDLLINSYPKGTQVLTKKGYLKRVKCATSQ
ncbi:hypothetical protein [Pseudoalteromonas luteoviolacea]|uniref:hypothetical protein n=1 Tax=Pseudoalteromonas luteoviolacea TaxID=43657 RepID=UPI001B368C80|nr:hypothetical protein [Pseudoalteromonas luteoviolacea]MBQ4836622.1 hypothetical protein [Pseudoalteromonas luteoviolacea]